MVTTTTTTGGKRALVRARWRAAVAALGGDPQAVAADEDALVAAWSAPTRRYHDLAHAAEVLQLVAHLAEEAELDPRQRAVVDLAACAHDVVYDGRPGEDERASARWLADVAERAGVAASSAAEAAALVRATAGHAAPSDAPATPVSAVLLDADLAVLARPRDGYDAYAAAVRAEYGHLDDATWRRGRAEVLRGLLARDRLFVLLGDEAEEHARANLQRELERLA